MQLSVASICLILESINVCMCHLKIRGGFLKLTVFMVYATLKSLTQKLICMKFCSHARAGQASARLAGLDVP